MTLDEEEKESWRPDLRCVRKTLGKNNEDLDSPPWNLPWIKKKWNWKVFRKKGQLFLVTDWILGANSGFKFGRLKHSDADIKAEIMEVGVVLGKE